VPTVQGVKGEATKPENPARGLVWMDIAAKVQERLAFDRLARAVAPPAAEPPKPASIAIPPAVRADGQLDLFADMEVAA
jgi:hypothetical protein